MRKMYQWFGLTGWMVVMLLGCGTPSVTVEQGPALPIPPVLEGKQEGDTTHFSMELQKGESTFLPGKKTETWGINQAFLGPTIRVKSGQKVQFAVKNSVGEVTSIHWHGLHIPAKMDGGPHQTIAPQEVWTPSFQIMQRASTNWYHPHPHGKTGIHVYMGLAGMFWIEDDQSMQLPLPKEYGVDDIPIVIQDRSFKVDGSFQYISGNMEQMVGLKGQYVLVNGAIKPTLQAPAQIIRLRLLNGSNGRMYNIGLANNRPFHQIATEGGLLEKPVQLTRLLLAPGERAEILVDLRQEQGKTLALMSYSSETTHLLDKEDTRGGMHADRLDQEDYPLMTILASKPAKQNYDIPQTLVPLQRLMESDASVTRTIELNVKGAMGTKQDFTINDNMMNMSRIDIQVKLNATEIWELKNPSDMPHPFHIHDITFLILDRNGKPPAAHEQGWKDTVLVHFNETVRVIAKFEHFADPQTPYMYHCHILEHEDAGMMGQFLVLP